MYVSGKSNAGFKGGSLLMYPTTRQVHHYTPKFRWHLVSAHFPSQFDLAPQVSGRIEIMQCQTRT